MAEDLPLESVAPELWVANGLLLGKIVVNGARAGLAGSSSTTLSAEARAQMAAAEGEMITARGASGALSDTFKFGENATGHLIKHRDALGFGNVTSQQSQKLIPQMKDALQKLFNQADQSLTRIGRWHEYNNAKFFISDGRTIVTQSDGTFVTVFNGVNNGWYRAATKVF